MAFKRALCWILLIACIAGISPARADWLASQAQSDGSYSTADNLATPTQATAEAVRTLRLLGRASEVAAADSFLASQTDTGAEYLSRKIVSEYAAGTLDLTLVPELMAYQNSDGGFGGQSGFASDPLDTAFALDALASSGNSGEAAVGPAVSYLLKQQAADGGWIDSGGDLDVYTTALAARALSPYQDQYPAVSPALASAATFLLSRRNAGSSWGSDLLSAQVVLTLATIGADPASVQQSAAALSSAQLADGSWSDDVYSTALALRALLIAKGSASGPSATAGSIGGYVLSSGTGEPLAGATVTVSGTSLSATSGSDGYFLIAGVPTGAATVVTSLSGYASASVVATPQSGQVVTVGPMILSERTNTAVVRGVVVDASSQVPLSGVAITLTGPASYAVVSSANGSFELDGIAAGTYTINLSANGYTPVAGSLSAPAGSVTAIRQALTAQGTYQDSSPGTITGQVVDATTGQPVPGATLTLNGNTTASSASDGSFSFAAVPRENCQIQVTASGYASRTYSFIFAPGDSGSLGTLPIFAATGSSAPTTLTLVGTVIDGVDNHPLAGASVTVTQTGHAYTVDSNGQFTVSGLTSLSFDLTISAASYQTRSFSGSASGFGQVSGSFALTPASSIGTATTSTISGTVTDATSGKPIAGATLTISGSSMSVTSAADGSYLLANIQPLALTLAVAAPGYQSRTYNVDVTQAGAYALNVQMTAVTGSDQFQVLSFSPLQSSSGANTVQRFAAQVANLQSTAQQASILIDVQDATGATVATVSPYAPGTTVPAVQVSFAPSATVDLVIPWNTEQFPSGTYRLVLRVVQPGTVTRDLPSGQVLAQADTHAVIDPTSAILGQVAFNPPLTQAGSSAPVDLSALIINSGNVPLTGKSFTLTVSGSSSGQVLASLHGTAASIGVGQNVLVDFGTWVPTTPGNLPVTVSADDPTVQGRPSGTLYVGNEATGTFTVDKSVVPLGTQTVHATVAMQGVDATTATSTDPLFAAVKQAIQRGGLFVGPQVRQWNQTNRCLGCHIQTQSFTGMAAAVDKANVSAADVEYLYNDIAGSLQADGRILPAHTELPETQTALAIWALSGWHDASQVFRALYRGSLYQLSRMSTSGNQSWWNNDYCGIWVCNVPSQVMTTVKGMVATLNMAKQLGTTAVNDYVFADTGQNFGIANMMGVQETADGSVWFLDNAGTLYRRNLTTGTNRVVATGLGSPTIGLVVAPDGTAYVTNPSALIKIAPDGTKTTLLSGGSVRSLWDVEMGPDGNLYVSDTSTIWRVTPAGQATQFVSGGLINVLQGLAFDSSGNLYASNYGGWDILKITPDGTVSVFSDGLPFQPIWLRTGPDGYLYAMTQRYSSFGTVPPGIFRIDANGYVERLPLFSAPDVYGYNSMAVINGKICVNNSSDLHVYCLNIVPQDVSQLPALSNAVVGAARYTVATYGDNSPWNDIQAMRLITLGEARTQISDATLLSQIDVAMTSIASLLRSRQATDGGWPYYVGRASDPYATAFVGLALQYTNPSPGDPALRKAITFLLNSQQADGSWSPATGAFTTKLGPASFVMAFLPKALDLLGGIDTGLNITFPASVQLSNPSLPPTTQLTAQDGSTTYSWSLLGVTSQGRSIDFDLTLANMGYNENRAVASSAYLSFANSFTGDQLKLDLAIPQVRAVSALAISVGVDQSSYPANTPVNISSTITNVGPPVTSGQVHLFIRASNGTLVADLGSTGFGALATGASTVVPGSWNTGTLLAGGYEVDAELYDATGQQVDESVTPFSIVAPNAVVTAAITADKTSYQASDSVILTAKIVNASANAVVAPSTATLSVQTPSGAALFSINFAVDSLMPGAIVEVPEVVPLQHAVNGAYPVQLAIYDSTTHALLATATGTFQVQDSLALALKGSVTAQSASLYVGQSQVCTDIITNNGTQAVSGLALQQLLVRLDQTATINTTPQSVDLAPGGSQQFLQGFSTAGLTPGDYGCILQAQTNGTWQTLGYAAFKLTPPPIVIQAQLALGSKGRVLALLDATPTPPCGRVHDIGLWAAFHTRLPDDAQVEVDLLDPDGNRVDSETVAPTSFRGDVHRSPGHGANLMVEGISPDVITIDVRGEPELVPGYQIKVIATAASLPAMTLETGVMGSAAGWPTGEGTHFGDFESSRVSPLVGAEPPRPAAPEPTPAQRQTFLESLLQQAGWSYTIVTDEESFERDMLSGGYSEYALFAERLKLDDQMQKAMREAVDRGDGLLDADEHDEDEEAGLSDALGIRFAGRQSRATSVEFLGTGLPELGTTPLAFPRDALRARAKGAQVTALFPDLVGVHDDTAGTDGPRQRRFYSRDGADPRGEDRGRLDTAMTTYGYGQGQSIYAGYDLLAEATQAGSSSLEASALRDALGHVMPSLSALHAGEIIPLHLSLQNQGIATSGQVQMAVPAGVTVVDPGSGTVSNGVLTFTYSLAVGQTLDFYAWVRLPDQSGATEFDALIQTSQNGVYSDYGHATFTAGTDAYATITDALSLAGASREFRDSLFWLQTAQWRLSRNQPEYALASLLQATDGLVDNQSPQAVLLRLDIDQAIWTLSRQVAGDDLH